MYKKIFKIISLIFVITTLSFMLSQSNDIDKLKDKEQELKSQISETKRLIDKIKSKNQNSLREINLLKSQVENRKKLININNIQIQEIQSNIDENKDKLIILISDLKKIKEELKYMMRYAYKNRNNNIQSAYFLSSNTVNEAFNRLRYINLYNKSRKKQIDKLKRTQEDLYLINIKNEDNKSNIERKQLQLINEQTKLKTEENELNKVIESNKVKELELKTELEKQQNERNKIRKIIRDAIKNEINKKQNNTDKAKNTNITSNTKKSTNKEKVFVTNNDIQLSKSFSKNKGKLPWPVNNGTISSLYGRQKHNVVSTAIIDNSGIDIITERKSIVKSVFNGEVSSILIVPGAGYAIIVSHGDYRSVYTNIEQSYVTLGQKINTGEKLGHLLVDENSNNSICHFEIWQITTNDVFTVNPSFWLNK